MENNNNVERVSIPVTKKIIGTLPSCSLITISGVSKSDKDYTLFSIEMTLTSGKVITLKPLYDSDIAFMVMEAMTSLDKKF